MDELNNITDCAVSKESDLSTINTTDYGTSLEDVLRSESSIPETLAYDNPNEELAAESFPYLDSFGVDPKALAHFALGTEIPSLSDLRKEIPILESFGKDPQSLRDPHQIMHNLGDLWENIPQLDLLGKNIPGLIASRYLGKEISHQGYFLNQGNSEKSLNSDIPAQFPNTFQKYIPEGYGYGLGEIARDLPGLSNLQERFPFLENNDMNNKVLANLGRRLYGNRSELSSLSGLTQHIPEMNNTGRDVPGLNELAQNIPGMEGLNIDQMRNRMAQVGDVVESVTGISPAHWVSQIPGSDLMGFGESKVGDGSSSGDSNDFESVFSDLRSIGGDVVEIITDSKQFFTQLGALVGVFGTLVNTGSNVIDDYNNGKVAASIFNVVLLVSIQIPTITAMLLVFLKDKIHLSFKGFMKIKEDLQELVEDLRAIMESDDEYEDNSDFFDDCGDTECFQTRTDDSKMSETETPVEFNVPSEKAIHQDSEEQKDTTFKDDVKSTEVQTLPKTDIKPSPFKEKEKDSVTAIQKTKLEFQFAPKKDIYEDSVTSKHFDTPQAGFKRKSDNPSNAHADPTNSVKCIIKKRKNSKKKRLGKEVGEGTETKGDDKMALGLSVSASVSASSQMCCKEESKLTSLVGSDEFQPVISQDESTISQPAVFHVASTTCTISEPVFHNSGNEFLVSIKESHGFKPSIPEENSRSRPFFLNKEFESGHLTDGASSNSKSAVHKDKFKTGVSSDRFKPKIDTDDIFNSKSFTSNDGFKTALFSDEKFKPFIALDESKSIGSHNGRSKSQVVGKHPNDGFQTVVRRRRRKKMESQRHFALEPAKTASRVQKENSHGNKMLQQSTDGCSHVTTQPHHSLHGSHTFQSYNASRPKEMSSTSTQDTVDPTAFHDGNVTDGKDNRSEQFTFERKGDRRKAEPTEVHKEVFRRKTSLAKSSEGVVGSVPHQLHERKHAGLRDVDSKD